jgi:hypothetical protein
VTLAVGPEAGTLQHHHERHPVGERDLGDAVPLGVGRAADRPRLHREVLGRDHHRTPGDATRTHHERVGGGIGPAHERAELEERSRIEQVCDARPGVELARAAVLLQPLVAAHRARHVAALLEVVDDFVPVPGLLVGGHGCPTCP